MIFEIDKYQVKIISELDLEFTVSSYKNEYLSNSLFKLTSKFGIIILENGAEVNSVIIGAENGASSLHETSCVFDEKQVLICCGDSIFCLDIPTLHLNWKTKVDEITAFQIFKINNGYIIHGELEICRINKFGDIVWKVGGADIFLTPEGGDYFEVKDNIIKTRDWEHRIYKWNLDGAEI